MISPESMLAFPPVFMRILGAMIVLPIGQNLSGIGKVFALSFGLSLFFTTAVDTTVPPSYSGLFFEFLVGCIITLPAALTIDAVRSLGELFDNQRGVSFAAVYDPAINVNASVMSHLGANFCLLVLISAGLLENIMFAIKGSFTTLPLYSFSSESLSITAVNIIRFISILCGGFFQSFLICALLFVLVDVASIFLSKVLTQAGLNQEVFLVKTITGFALVLAILKLDFAPALLAYANPQSGLISLAP